MTDDQDVNDWRREHRWKSSKQSADRMIRQRREEFDELMTRYGDERVDDRESVPRID